jgi:hypothetical protein
LQPFETVASLEKEVPMQNMFASKPIRRPALKALSTLFSLGTACRHGSALAGESSPVVSSRLRNFLRWQIREGESAGPQPELLDFMNWIPVLGANNMSQQLRRLESMTAALVGVFFFFAVVGSFGLKFAIAGLAVFVLVAVVVCIAFPTEGAGS